MKPFQFQMYHDVFLKGSSWMTTYYFNILLIYSSKEPALVVILAVIYNKLKEPTLVLFGVSCPFTGLDGNWLCIG